ncbi:NAD(P)/FAD-dependent oxidoreductase [Kitasatospora cystarginea]|uniref:NAD(P)/FAD-dependent oxidoreductase n=1 Tax=Kitasatospora cystarginea TaxID=58350 RepID=UPI0031E33409
MIIGAGLAGGSLARQLRLEQPDLDIVVVDRITHFPPGLDEASGEEFSNYANRVLRIGPYLRKHHYVSSGMRFFFDSSGRDLPLDRMSEIGGRSPHPIPTYLIDRPVVEQALCEMNRECGVRVLLGTEVLHCGPGESPAKAITIDGDNGHLVRTTAGVIRCRWLVDAAGEESPIARMLDLVSEDDRNPIAAAWGRFDGCLSLDDLGTKAWRQRVPHWGRASSMTYFMYRGYWIWLMPLSESQYSIGVVFDRRHVQPRVGSGEELLAFLQEHRAVGEILGPDPQPVAFGTRERLARFAKQQFSEQRWFLTGNAGTVLDPMFASGSSRRTTSLSASSSSPTAPAAGTNSRGWCTTTASGCAAGTRSCSTPSATTSRAAPSTPGVPGWHCATGSTTTASSRTRWRTTGFCCTSPARTAPTASATTR